MDGAKLNRLKVLLQKQSEEEAVKKKEASRRPRPSKEAIAKFYQAHGMMTPIEGFWKRPIHKGVYSCPLSEPMTTLVTWDSLPLTVQQYYTKPTDGDIVEVLRSHLLADGVLQEEGQQQQHQNQGSLNRRPLGGNLSNKLTEYTRGVSGQCKPFRPGGVDQEELDNNDIDPFLTEKAIQDSLKVLKQGSKASWKDGTLITAPPGVGFKVGISYGDVRGDDDVQQQAEAREERVDLEFNLENFFQEQHYETGATEAPRIAPAIRWDQAFLDDDSLFGSSESESDSDESKDEDDEGNEKDDDLQEEDLPPVVATEEEVKQIPAVETITGSDEDIDGLLTELSRAEARSKKEIDSKNPKKEINMNALQLAERQAELQKNTTRKSWATTNLLPIDDFHSLIPNPALTYPFTLDTFQQQAIARLERSESVFVAAHTSAGKTVVAEYASALAKQRGTRCIYTSPIKALSNQKFRDFSQKFGSQNVGLITGDLQLNVDDSTTLIMTTEILRSMLYRGADLIRDIEWVIFDEVHYVNDSERGVVWEEVIIMLPQYVNLIFLSATTPNTLEFSDWIGRTKRKLVHVIKTDYRPVPLSHFLWANLKLHKVMEGRSGFFDKGYQEASNALQPKKAADKKGAKGKSTTSTSTRRGPGHLAWQLQGSKANWMSLIRFLEREELTPTVVFSFSKKKCEEIAHMLQSLDLNTASERSAVQGFTLQTVARLSPNDAVLPQVLNICDMVQRGIGVHHGGLLPILKEMVEILFARGLIKVLFATETFAMGVNMPARCVVFNSIRKHDGTQFRVLEPGEYTQMAGRAGRRGIDKVGTVIMCCFGDTPPPLPILRNMLTGLSTMLRSQFRLTYNMILNLLRVEEMSVEGMIKRSFSEFATQRALTANEYPKLLVRGEKTLKKLEEQRAEVGKVVGAEDLEEYFSTCTQLMSTNSELLVYITTSSDSSGESVLQPGRILLVSAARDHGVVRSPALVLHTRSSRAASSIADTGKKIDNLICMVLLPESFLQGTQEQTDGQKQGAPKSGTVGFIGSAKQRHYAIHEISMDQILLVSATKKRIEPTLLFTESTSSAKSTAGRGHSSAAFFGDGARANVGSFDNAFAGMKDRGKTTDDGSDFFGKKMKVGVSSKEQAVDNAVDFLVNAEKDEMSSGLPSMDLRDTVKRGNDVVEFRNRCGLIDGLAEQMRSFVSHHHPSLEQHYSLLERQYTLGTRVEALRHLLSNESLQLFPDFLQRKAVLRTLGYIDEFEAVCVKGRVACEVNTCEELIVTEMVFEGILNELEPTEIVAALSSLLYQQKSDDDEFDMEIPESLLNCCKQMKTIATNLGQLQKEHGLDIDPIDYADATLKFGLVHVVYEWALGVPFKNICELTTVQEGSIVRCITRLDELCREVRNCARVVGNPTLYRKMEAASVAIKRDIVFASSLYVS